MATKNRIVEALLARQRVKRLKQQNKKLALDLQHEEGELVPVEDMKRYVIACNLAVKAKFLGLPGKMAPRVRAAQTDEEAQRLLREEVEGILSELAYGFRSGSRAPDAGGVGVKDIQGVIQPPTPPPHLFQRNAPLQK